MQAVSECHIARVDGAIWRIKHLFAPDLLSDRGLGGGGVFVEEIENEIGRCERSGRSTFDANVITCLCLLGAVDAGAINHWPAFHHIECTTKVAVTFARIHPLTASNFHLCAQCVAQARFWSSLADYIYGAYIYKEGYWPTNAECNQNERKRERERSRVKFAKPVFGDVTPLSCCYLLGKWKLSDIHRYVWMRDCLQRSRARPIKHDTYDKQNTNINTCTYHMINIT